jgi:NAD(P)H-dependent flavin oxidoreductase YrpB (nitropropane dioxygenase family)
MQRFYCVLKGASMKTRITELLGIKYPIIISGMSWISVPKMVAAVSNAGGLGILATGPLSSVQTKEAVQEIGTLTDKPFGANATLLFPGAVDNAKVLLEEKVPVINFALGKGDWVVKEASEATTCTGAPAVINAIYDATGVMIKNMPATPEKMWRALKEKKR